MVTRRWLVAASGLRFHNESSFSPTKDDTMTAATNNLKTFSTEAKDTLNDVSENTVKPALSEALSKVDELRIQGLQRVREIAADARDQAIRGRDVTVEYIKDEPIKSVLIASAVGAGIALLVRALGSRNN